MAKSNPFEEIFEKIADLLSIAQVNKDKPLSDKKIYKNIEKQLGELEKGMEVFRKITDEAIKECGLEEEMVLKIVRSPEEEGLNRQDKRVLQKAKKIRSEVEKVEKDYAQMTRLAKLQKKRSKTAGKKRKKKFKKLGGEGWMPL